MLLQLIGSTYYFMGSIRKDYFLYYNEWEGGGGESNNSSDEEWRIRNLLTECSCPVSRPNWRALFVLFLFLETKTIVFFFVVVFLRTERSTKGTGRQSFGVVHLT